MKSIIINMTSKKIEHYTEKQMLEYVRYKYFYSFEKYLAYAYSLFKGGKEWNI